MKLKDQQTGEVMTITVQEFGEIANQGPARVLSITELSDDEKAYLKQHHPENYMDPDEMQAITQDLLAKAMRGDYADDE